MLYSVYRNDKKVISFESDEHLHSYAEAMNFFTESNEYYDTWVEFVITRPDLLPYVLGTPTILVGEACKGRVEYES